MYLVAQQLQGLILQLVSKALAHSLEFKVSHSFKCKWCLLGLTNEKRRSSSKMLSLFIVAFTKMVAGRGGIVSLMYLHWEVALTSFFLVKQVQIAIWNVIGTRLSLSLYTVLSDLCRVWYGTPVQRKSEKWGLWEKGNGIGFFNLGKNRLRGDLTVDLICLSLWQMVISCALFLLTIRIDWS